VRRLPFADPEHCGEAVRAAGEVVAADGVVLLPTETYYGLGADPTSATAARRIFAMKDRPDHMALPVLVADWNQLESLVVVSEEHRVRLSRSWPGALTVILPSRSELPAAPGGTVAVRIPDHALLRALLYRVGPLTGTSANRHGSPPCVGADASLASLCDPPDLVLDGGVTPGGSASTVVDLTTSEPEIVRQGAFRWDDFYSQFFAS
jgi:L-threonylcarbamoyladenylate synthase